VSVATPPEAPSARTHQALYRRWRAQTFGQIVGQEPVVQTLRNAVRTNQVAHALLFVGPRGTGKTSMARIVAKALNCTNLVDGEPDDACEACVSIREGRALDVVEMDAASNNKVDDIRDFLPRVATMPSGLRRKVFIVDEVQRIKEGWDLLLKTLEEPPDHVAFIFCTTDASQVRPAVLSRIQRFDFRPLTVAQIDGKLRHVLAAEGREADDGAVTLVARLAAGGMRDAESMLDQLLTSTGGRLTEEAIRDLLGMVEATTVDSFIRALVTHDARAGLQILQDLDDHGRDTRAFLNQVVDALRDAIVATVRGAGAAYPADALAAAARRLTAIDPTAAGPGGLRFQLELALLEPAAASAAAVQSIPPPAAASSGTSAAASRSTGAPTPAAAAATVPPATTTAAPTATHADPAPTAQAPSATAPSRSSAPAPARTPQRPTTPERPTTRERPTTPAPSESRPPAAAAAELPPPRPAQAPAAATPGAAEDGDLAALIRAWPEVVGWISARNPASKPLISVCRPMAIDGNVVTLGFPETQGFLKDVAERRRPLLEEGVGHFVGRVVAVRCVAANLEAAAPDPDFRQVLDKAREIFAEDLVDIGEIS
jgi:DNA polymerase-3 subunit gamma/tau